MAQVVLADPEEAGLAAMLAGLLAAAIQDPAKARLVDQASGTVTITVPDAEVDVGIAFERGVATVRTGGIPRPDVRIEMPSDTLLGFSTIPLVGGLPSLLSAAGRAFTLKLLRRQVKISGLRHVVLITQLNRLLSVA